MKKNRIISFIINTLFIFGILCSSFSSHGQERKRINTLSPVSRISIFESEDREKWQQPERVLEVFGVKEGDMVADIGAGSGYFTFRLSRKIGKTGKVYAVEIQQDMLNFIEKKMRKENRNNIVLVKSTETDPHLPSLCCSKVLAAHCYFELSKPVEFMKNLRQSLPLHAQVAVIDWHKKKNMSTVIGPPLKFRTSMEDVIKEMNSAGYELINQHDFLQEQYFLIFEARCDR